MAALSTDGDQGNSEPLKYKTWVLRVSIHCEGCKRKVKRILHSVEGVYTIDVDARQHKVAVTGNVEANTLLRKLEKSGKHAELWDAFHRNQSNEQPQQQQESTPPIQIQNQNQNQNPENQKFDEPQKTNNESQKGSETSGQHQQQQQQQQPQQVKEVRFEGNVVGEPPNPPANNPAGGGNGGGEGGGGASKKKKKKKKGNNANNTTGNNPNNNGGNSNNNNNNGGEVGGVGMEQGLNGGPPSTESQPNPTHHPNPGSMSSPPNCRVYEYPSPYYAPSPVYAVSYNTAYPSSSISASYYSAPPPYSYAYVHQGGDVDASAPLDWNPHAVPPPSDSFEMFSDENPNACAVM